MAAFLNQVLGELPGPYIDRDREKHVSGQPGAAAACSWGLSFCHLKNGREGATSEIRKQEAERNTLTYSEFISTFVNIN